MASAGLAVSGAVDSEGQAYLWGFNENSQLAKVHHWSVCPSCPSV